MRNALKLRLPALLLAAALLSLSACGARTNTSAADAKGRDYSVLGELETAKPTAQQTEADRAEEADRLAAPWEPDISFSTLDSEGNTWTDAAFAEHGLTMVNYWAYWCGPCVGELPSLELLYETYGDRGLLVLGISDEIYEASNRGAAADAGVQYPCLRYTEAFDPYLNSGYIPTTVFVDGQGKVLGEPYIGSRSYDDWAAIVEEFLP